MTLELALFFALAVVAVGAALGMLLSRNAVYAALFLILNLATIAVFFLLLSAPFIALVQITVYAGAIMVLFLFVIMLLGAERLAREETLPWQRPLAIGLGLILLVEGIYAIFFTGVAPPVQGLAQLDFGSPATVGEFLFSQYLLPFEAVSVLLLVAMIGAIVLTRRS